MTASSRYVPARVNKFRVVQDLVAGDNVINNNLALTASPTQVDVLDNATGKETAHRITAETANSVTIQVSAAATNRRITVLG